MTSTSSNIWKRFLFNNQHTTYNKDIIEYHLEYNNDNEKEENENEIQENQSNINIEEILIQYLDLRRRYKFFQKLLFRLI